MTVSKKRLPLPRGTSKIVKLSVGFEALQAGSRSNSDEETAEPLFYQHIKHASDMVGRDSLACVVLVFSIKMR